MNPIMWMMLFNNMNSSSDNEDEQDEAPQRSTVINDDLAERNHSFPTGIFVIGVMCLSLFLLFKTCMVTVQSYEIVYYNKGGKIGRLGPGYNFVYPWIKVTKVNRYKQQIEGLEY